MFFLALSYLALTMCWALSNPAGAAPDEPAHVTKAIGNSSWQIGSRPPPVALAASPLEQRNSSTVRIYKIPSRLDPSQLACFAFQPNKTANCQDLLAPATGGDADVASPVGDYPPFFYVPIGTVIRATATTPHQAVIAGRIVVAILFSGLVWLGLMQLARWLGRSSVLGYLVVVTPVEVFLGGSVNSSALEFASAAAVAAVVTTCVLKPKALAARSSHLSFLVAGCTLALSRQLGVLTLAIFVVVLLTSVGPRRGLEVLRHRSISLTTTVLAVGVAVVLGLGWEHIYDHPAAADGRFTGHQVTVFVNSWSSLVSSALGVFGWIDISLPTPAIQALGGVWIVLLAMALVLGRTKEALVTLSCCVVSIVVAFIVDVVAFFPLGAAIQGRHILPTVSLAMIFAGAVVTQRLGSLSPSAARRLYVAMSTIVALVQVLALYCNGRRYSVGVSGPWWWASKAQWSPSGGWALWLALTCLAGAFFLCAALANRPRGARSNGLREATPPDPAHRRMPMAASTLKGAERSRLGAPTAPSG